jgi:hypothetical protein
MKWILLLAATLTGCGTVTATPELSKYKLVENQNFYQAEGQSLVIVRWIRLSDQRLQAVCGNATGKSRSGAVFLGCAITDSSKICTIYTATNTTHQIFGHELRHCFQGKFHD